MYIDRTARCYYYLACGGEEGKLVWKKTIIVEQLPCVIN